VVEPLRDDANPLRLDAEVLDRAAADEIADHDHTGCAAYRPVPGHPAKCLLAPREHGRQVEVLEVVQRHDARLVDRRNADRQRVVHHIGACESCAQAARPRGCIRHRREPLRQRSCEPVLRRDLAWQPFARSGRRRRQHDSIVELADIA
jgi:hypothetical protein